jgi:predicted ArsR family transcriptional regulator
MVYHASTSSTNSTYPNHPGSRASSPETSRAAAKTIVNVAQSHRNRILEVLKGEAFGLSSEAIASRLGLTRYAVRPRISELVAMKAVVETPYREKNDTGRSVVIWRAV